MDIGAPELLVVLVIAVVVFGPRKLPQLARSLGEALHEWRENTWDSRPPDERHSRDAED